MVGLFGILFNKRNLLVMLISIELVFLGINLSFIFASIYLDDILGQVLVFFILTVVAGESAVALSLFTIIYQFRQSSAFINLKGYFIYKF
jgi:NADH-quinone oxidoreductase subunit K